MSFERPAIPEGVAENPPRARVEMRGIDKAFGGVRVLRDVSLRVNPGEVVALLGANGAGKSTLMKILTGLIRRDGGEIAIDGAAAKFAGPAGAAAAGVSYLPQEISLMPDMTVAENIAIARLPVRSRFGFRGVDDRAMREAARARLTQLGFPGIDPGAPVSALPIAERRVVEIARALAGDARLLIMDEPTAALTEQEAELIFRIVRRLKETGAAVIYISHYLREVFAIADRIVVLRDGRNAGEFVRDQTDQAEIVEAMLGATGGELFDARPRAASGPPVLSARGLSLDRRLSHIDLDVARGEILGVFGLVGSGVETLGRAIYGALGTKPAGEIRIEGAPYRPRSPMAGKAAGIGFIAAERKKEGIIAELSLRENLVAAFEERYVRDLFVSRAAEREEAERWIGALGIRASGTEQTIKTLSGGNQQKVCVARWLTGSVKVLILEEPTRGVDVGARRELYGELCKLADEGLALLVLSSDVEEVAGLCDRSLVIDRGRIAGAFPRGAPASALMAATALTKRADAHAS
jgi:ribose transport system ATP-binding protein